MHCLPFLYSNSFKEGTGRKTHSLTDNSFMADSGLLSQVPSNVHNKANTFFQRQRICWSWEVHPLVINKTLSCSMGNFRRQLSAEELSKQAIQLISASRRKSTVSRYESAWRKWSSWCRRKQVDTVWCPLNFILDFLSDAYSEGLQYSTIAGYRSAILAFHGPIDGVKVLGGFSMKDLRFRGLILSGVWRCWLCIWS